jgi:hypothetical protein
MLSSKILSIAKWFGGVIGGGMAILGVVTLIYAQGIKAEQKRSKDSTIEYKVDKLIVLDSVRSVKLDEIISNQDKIVVAQKASNLKFDKLNNSYIMLLKTDKKIDVLIQYLQEEQEVKKNLETSFSVTPFGLSIYKTQ